MPTPHSDHREGQAQPREAYAVLHDVLMRINDHPVTRLHQPVGAEALGPRSVESEGAPGAAIGLASEGIPFCDAFQAHRVPCRRKAARRQGEQCEQGCRPKAFRSFWHRVVENHNQKHIACQASAPGQRQT